MPGWFHRWICSQVCANLLPSCHPWGTTSSDKP
jgi:hypothetical protein